MTSLMMKNLKICQVIISTILLYKIPCNSINLLVDNFDEEDNQASQQPPTFISPDKIPESKRPTAPVYVVEYFMGACLVAYVMNYIFGRITNGNIAQQWFENARSFLVRSLLSTIYL